MRNIKYILFTLTALAVFSACGNKKKQQMPDELLRPASMTYTKKDTADINYLVNNYVSNFAKGDLEACSNMLYKFRGDSVAPYTAEQKDSFQKAFKVFHVYDAQVQRMTLRSDRNNQVDIAIKIMKDGSIADNKGVTTLSLNPVSVNGKWYLTLLDKDADGVEDVYKEEAENESH